MESTRKKKTPLDNQQKLGRRLGDINPQARGGLKGNKALGYDYNNKDNKLLFLVDVFDDLFGYDRDTQTFSDRVYSFTSENGESVEGLEDPLKNKTHVYYNSHYYIEIIPGEWDRFNTREEEFVEQQLKNIKPIKQTHNIKIYEELKEGWKNKGYLITSLEEYYHLGYCRYCGKRISPTSENTYSLEIAVNDKIVEKEVYEFFPKDYKEKHDPGRYLEYCCEDHKRRQRQIELYYNSRLKEGKVGPGLIELHDKPHLGIELERLLRPRCVYCGGIISDDKPLQTVYCDGECEIYETCDKPRKKEFGYCVWECGDRKVRSNKCRDAFNYRLKKERKVNPNITYEEFVDKLSKEREGGRRRIFWINVLRAYLKDGGDPYDDRVGNTSVSARRYFKDEYESIVAQLTQEIRIEKNRK